MELIFRALSHPGRRLLLDKLLERDGQTLAELERHLSMTRFGVMKHLRLLEAAGLLATRRRGREKLHYLNPVPIRLIRDRWIRRYATAPAAATGRPRAAREASTMSGPRHVYEVFIRTSPEKLWEAITNPEFTRRYFYGSSVESTWRPGDPVLHRQPDGSVALSGTVLEADPPCRLVTTFVMTHDPEGSKDRPSRVTWDITPLGPSCKLTLVHDDFDGETRTFKQVGPGWNPVLSGLKTLLETGQPLEIRE